MRASAYASPSPGPSSETSVSTPPMTGKSQPAPCAGDPVRIAHPVFIAGKPSIVGANRAHGVRGLRLRGAGARNKLDDCLRDGLWLYSAHWVDALKI